MDFKKIISQTDGNVSIQVAAGHFATNHSHVNQYVDLTDVKSRHLMAKRVAKILSEGCAQTKIDSIICLDGTNMLGAYIADSLAGDGVNSGSDICVLTPELNPSNQLVFLQNTQEMISGKSVLMLLASVSTGKTILRASECIDFYKGNLSAICAVFSASHDFRGIPIKSVFTEADLSDYHTYATNECEMCQSNRRIDAKINSFGFSSL